MSADKANIHDPVMKLNGHDKPVIISFDIKYHPVAGKNTGIAVYVFYVGR